MHVVLTRGSLHRKAYLERAVTIVLDSRPCSFVLGRHLNGVHVAVVNTKNLVGSIVEEVVVAFLERLGDGLLGTSLHEVNDE